MIKNRQIDAVNSSNTDANNEWQLDSLRDKWSDDDVLAQGTDMMPPVPLPSIADLADEHDLKVDRLAGADQIAQKLDDNYQSIPLPPRIDQMSERERKNFYANAGRKVTRAVEHNLRANHPESVLPSDSTKVGQYNIATMLS